MHKGCEKVVHATRMTVQAFTGAARMMSKGCERVADGICKRMQASSRIKRKGCERAANGTSKTVQAFTVTLRMPRAVTGVQCGSHKATRGSQP